MTSKQISRILPLAAIALLTVAAVGNATARVSADKQGIDRGFRACVAEIGKHANYNDAIRVVHWVIEFEQMNMVELEMRVETSIYLTDDGSAARRYSSSCVRGVLDKLVAFRIRENDTKT